MLFNPLAMGASVAATTQAAAGQTALVSGTVTDETGGVMQAVTVRLFVNDATEPVGETTTDGDGRFTFEVPVGTYRVQVAAQDFQTVDQTIRATPGMEPLTLTLPLPSSFALVPLSQVHPGAFAALQIFVHRFPLVIPPGGRCGKLLQFAR